MMVTLSLASCQKEPIEPTKTEGEVPEGYVKIEVEHSADFGNIELSTRSGDNALIATAREMAIKNAYLCVFADDGDNDAADDKLIQFKPVIRDVVGSTTMYYAVLEEVKSPVILHGVSNIDQSTIDLISATEVGGAYKISRQDFYDNANITYPGETNQALRNDDNGLLTKYVERITLSQLTRDKIVDVKAVTKFSYARVDVVMPEPYADYPQVLGISVPNAPTLPYSPSRTQTFVESHEVTPETNQHSYSGEFWPTGVTTENQATKYAQGMYIYSTAFGIDALTDVAKATYLIIRARKDASSPSGGTYYKIALRLKDGVTGEYDYSIKASNRYLVRVHALDSDGYASAEEAIAGPPSNINYDIIIDGTSTSITSNGQYYIGTDQANYRSLVNYSQESNMMYKKPTMITEGNIKNITTHEDGTYEFDFVFSYNSGDASITNSSLSTKTLELPAGISIMTATTGYHDSQTWDDSFGTKKLRLKSTSNNIDGEVVIKVGELTLKSRIEISGGIVTDYTDAEFVNELTGLTDGYGGVSGLRIANSYMATPHSLYDVIIFIPVSERINEFWRNVDYAGTSQTDTYAGLLTADWTNNTDYSVELSWYDGTDIDNLVIEKAYSPASKNAIKVTLPPGFEHQNIAVNVKHGTTIIWSWHLWVSGYNPYFTALKEDASSAAAYPVRSTTDQNEPMTGTDNALHSYNGAVWSSGIYANKFIMDRNLGGMSANFAGYGGTTSGKGAIFFQFGRKDPFPRKAGLATENGQKSFADVVNNPNVFITNTTTINWCNETDAQLTTILWNDMNVPNAGYTTGKSIFDPSPLGFRLPIQGTWELFTLSNSPWSNASTTQYSYGRLYNRFVYYPASGYLERADASLGWVNAEGSNWSSSPNSSSEGLRLAINSGLMDPNRVIPRTYGFPVRPVQE